MIDKHLILAKDSARLALERLNDLGEEKNLTIFVANSEKKILGSVTDGDIRRGLLRGLGLEDTVDRFMNGEFHALSEDEIDLKRLGEIRNQGIKLIPILNSDGVLVDYFNARRQTSILPIEAVIMAGGRGHRLRPLTDSVPKPLLKVGDRAIIDLIILRLKKFGVKKIHLMLHYRSDQIIEHVKRFHGDNEVRFSFHVEERPMGTFSALEKIQNISSNDILLMNSDLLTNVDFEKFYLSFKESSSFCAVATKEYGVDVPYAILNCDSNVVKSLEEKPKVKFKVNAGIYLFKTEVLRDKRLFEQELNAAEVLEYLINKGDTVTHYNIPDYWLDIGRHDDYEKANRDVDIINFEL